MVNMKAVTSLTKGINCKSKTSTNCVRHLQYNMDVLSMEYGFLINFPHKAGFPSPPSGAAFVQQPLCGVTDPLSDVQLRDRRKNVDAPEIVYFRRINKEDSCVSNTLGVKCITDLKICLLYVTTKLY